MKKILVANRGEIALRIMRSLREMNITTVAVYSEADRTSPHVLYADEAYCIGAPPSSQSYLRGERIIEVALKSGAEGIHPGFGFLSENAQFARDVQAAGLIFIGPSPEAIDMMGNKLTAKAAAAQYQVPLVPGTEGAVSDVAEALRLAQQIGFPLLIKAAAGGGGKGMRIVRQGSELEEQMKLAISEAQSAFGDGAVFIEKYVTAPRHIEIQILADQHGNTLYLFERECSIQRRHQKVLEEAPSAVVSPQMRQAMGECAVRIAQSCNYAGAGTVEFIVDEDLNFYFLEMNTRLQVEHPVTEMITGIDLVKEQVRVARGEKLRFRQEDLQMRGHALELRVYAEDPANNFLPDIGTLQTYIKPEGAGVRVDDGFVQGMDIPIYYDPMIAKLIVHAEDRTAAIAKMKRAIDEYQITGITTTLSFGKWLLEQPEFISADIDTHFIQKHFTAEKLQNSENDTTALQIAAQIAIYAWEKQQINNQQKTTSLVQEKQGIWKRKRTTHR